MSRTSTERGTTDQEAMGVLAVLSAAWPRHDLPAATVALWVDSLRRIPRGAHAAARALVRSDQWFPTLNRFLETVNAARRATALASGAQHALAMPRSSQDEALEHIANIRRDVFKHQEETA